MVASVHHSAAILIRVRLTTTRYTWQEMPKVLKSSVAIVQSLNTSMRMYAIGTTTTTIVIGADQNQVDFCDQGIGSYRKADQRWSVFLCLLFRRVRLSRAIEATSLNYRSRLNREPSMINHKTKKLIQTVHDVKYGKPLVTYIYESGHYYERQTYYDYKRVETIVWGRSSSEPEPWVWRVPISWE